LNVPIKHPSLHKAPSLTFPAKQDKQLQTKFPVAISVAHELHVAQFDKQTRQDKLASSLYLPAGQEFLHSFVTT
jgi:hypothetical protein